MPRPAVDPARAGGGGLGASLDRLSLRETGWTDATLERPRYPRAALPAVARPWERPMEGRRARGSIIRNQSVDGPSPAGWRAGIALRASPRPSPGPALTIPAPRRSIPAIGRYCEAVDCRPPLPRPPRRAACHRSAAGWEGMADRFPRRRDGFHQWSLP